MSEVVIPGGDRAAFKRYHPHVLQQHGTQTEAKLGTMIAHAPTYRPNTHQALVWPRGLVYEAGTFTGLVMPLLQGDWFPLVKVVDRRSRRDAGIPHWTWGTMVTVARNLALAVSILNATGAAYGDLNEENIVVSKKGLVTLFDLDTCSFEVAGRRYPGSGFVRDDWRPPEYRSASDPFTIVGDRWALAVEIYMLLMESYRPYAAAGFTGLTPRDYVTRGLFPVADDTLRAHPNAPPLDVLPPELRQLFRRCFRDGHSVTSLRPSAAEWASALRDVAASTRTCSSDPEHVFSSHRSSCPWCEREVSAAGRVRQQSQTSGGATQPTANPLRSPVPAAAGVAAPTTVGGANRPPATGTPPNQRILAGTPAPTTASAAAPTVRKGPTATSAAPPVAAKRSRRGRTGVRVAAGVTVTLLGVGGIAAAVIASRTVVTQSPPRVSQPTSPPPHSPPPVRTYGPFTTTNRHGSLTVRRQPTTRSRAVDTLDPRTNVQAACHTRGELVTASGRKSRVWVKIARPSRGWVTSVYLPPGAVRATPRC